AVRSALGFATQVVARQDLALDQSDRILARAREIATLTANGTATVESRQQAAVEVAELERGLLAQANTELSGRYVFAGLTSGAAPFASLDDSGFDPLNPYSGPATPFLVRSGPDQTVAITTPGDQVFEPAIAAIDGLRVALAAGQAPAASIDELDDAAAVLRAERTIVGGRARRRPERGRAEPREAPRHGAGRRPDGIDQPARAAPDGPPGDARGRSNAAGEPARQHPALGCRAACRHRR